MKSILTHILLFFLLFSNANIFAQEAKLVIDGIVKDEETGEPLINCNVELLDAGNVIKTFVTTYNGKFIFEVLPQKELVLRCAKREYVAKMISVSTQGIEQQSKSEELLFSFKAVVRLFKEMPDLDVSILSQPIGSIFYSASQKDFDYTVNRDLKRKIEKLQEEVERKIKDKQKREKEEAELAAKEEKKKKKQAKKPVEEEIKITAKEPILTASTGPSQPMPSPKHEPYTPKIVMQHLDDIPEVTDVNQTFEEGYNYNILATTCVYDADYLELKKISFNWGGRYYKRNSYDITDLSYYKLMEYIQPEGNGYDTEAPKRLH